MFAPMIIIPRFLRKFTDQNTLHFTDLLMHTNWNHVIGNHDTNISYNIFLDTISSHYNRAFPRRKVTNKRKKTFKHPWTTNGILISSKMKNKLYKRSLKFPLPENIASYKKYKNILTNLTRASKSLYYKRSFFLAKNNIKETWNIINSLLNRKSSKASPNFFCHNDTLITNRTDISNHFNDYFINVAKNLADRITPSAHNFSDYLDNHLTAHGSFFLNPTNEAEIFNILNDLKNSAAGHDDISPKIIKMCGNVFLKPLTHICNLSLINGCFPDQLKIAKVVPIHKSDNPNLFSNYRPISVLPVFSKVLEKLMHVRLYTFLESHNILYHRQYGFRPGYSTNSALFDVTNNILNNMEKSQFTLGVFLDLSKAFDTVNHNILLNKLYHYGIRGTALNWFKDYLSRRHQFVLFNSTSSTSRPISSGVPQGSILGPLLFLLYINDLPNVSKILSFVIYADDTNIFLNHVNIDSATNIMNCELVKLAHWFAANKLSLNINKTKFIVFHHINKPFLSSMHSNIHIHINGTPIEQVHNIKFLGVFLDPNLKWKFHINYVSKKVAKSVGILTRIRHLIDTKTALTIYYSLIHSYLNYCISIWGSNYITNLSPINILQKRAIRVISQVPRLTHTKPLFLLHGILNIQKLVISQVAVAIFNRFYNHCPYVLCSTILPIHNHPHFNCHIPFMHGGFINSNTISIYKIGHHCHC